MQNQAAAAGNTSGDWQLLGPKEPMQDAEGGDIGRINAVAFDPSDPHTIYAGTPKDGLWVTHDDGNTWTSVGDPSLGIQDIAIAPRTPQTIYLLTGDGDASDPGGPNALGLSTPSIGVIKSLDGGKTWRETELHFHTAQMMYGYRLVIDPDNPEVLLAAMRQGLWRTADGGHSWSTVLKSDFIWDVQFHPTNPAIVYAAAMQISGQTCATVVVRSIDMGQTWQPLHAGLPTSGYCGEYGSMYRVRLAVTPASPDSLYVLYGALNGFTIGLYRSDDRGNTFTKQSSTEPPPQCSTKPVATGCSIAPLDLRNKNVFGYQDNDFQSQTDYTISMAVSPTNVNRVYVGGVDTFGSNDGGKTWTRTSFWTQEGGIHYVHADIHMLAYHGGALYAASDGGIFRSMDPDKPGLDPNWNSVTKINTGIAIAQIYYICSSPQQPDIFFYGAQDNGTYRLDITGVAHQILGGDGYVCQVDPRNPNTLYASLYFGQIYLSDDPMNGNFEKIAPVVNGTNIAGPILTPFALGPADPMTGYADLYACYGDVWYKQRLGDWQNLTNGALGSSRECRQVALSADAKTIYVAKAGTIDITQPPGIRDERPPFLGGPGVYRSIDGGATWQSIGQNLPLADAAVTDIAVSPSDPQRVWVTFQGYEADVRVFASIDRGATWTNLSQGLPNEPAFTLAAATGSANPIYLGTERGVYYRDDQVNRWVPFKQGLPADTGGHPLVVTSLLIQEAQHRLVASTFSRGVWISDLYAP